MDTEQKILDIRSREAKISSRRYDDEYENFIKSDGRRERRVIDIPDPAYSDGHSELTILTNDILSVQDEHLTKDYLSSLEVDLDYYDYLQESISSMLGMGLSQFDRQARRILTEIEKVAAVIANSQSTEQIFHNSSLIEIVPAIKEVHSELIKYIAKNPNELYTLRPRLFEELIAEILRSHNWEIELTPETRDGGFDILAISRDNKTGVKTGFIVECKRYSMERKVGIQVARELLQVKSELSIPSAMIVTSSDFTKGVYDFCLCWFVAKRSTPSLGVITNDKSIGN